MNIGLVVIFLACAVAVIGMLVSLPKAAKGELFAGADFFLTLGVIFVPLVGLALLTKMPQFPLAEAATSIGILILGAFVAYNVKVYGGAKASREQKPKRDLVLLLIDGALGANFYVRPRISRQEDGTILIKTGQLGMAQENNEALKGFARLYVAGPAVIEDDVAGEGWRNIERGIEQTLTGYFNQVVGPPGFAPFAARALREANGESYAFIRIRGNVSNADEEALRAKIDSAMSSIDELYQSGKVQIVEEGL